MAHILVLVPEQASADKIDHPRAGRTGAGKIAGRGAFSHRWRPNFPMPRMRLKAAIWLAPGRSHTSPVSEALQKMKPGEVSPVLRSPNGFHILKLLDRRSKDAPVVITQTHARHILIKTSELVSENEAKNRLLEIKQRIDKGANFAEQARLYSEDGSAPQGGDLGWLSPGETVPEFENAMDALKPGQVSGLVQSGFGWHVIQVLERRNTDVTVEQKRSAHAWPFAP